MTEEITPDEDNSVLELVDGNADLVPNPISDETESIPDPEDGDD